MNKRERVRCTIAHREPDRVPKGELCIEAGLANRLLQKSYGRVFMDSLPPFATTRDIRDVEGFFRSESAPGSSSTAP